MLYNELAAQKLGEDKVALKKRLQNARAMLMATIKKNFGVGEFDFAGKRLVSSQGKLILQWKLRDKPDEPITYHNQQTSRGTVFLILKE